MVRVYEDQEATAKVIGDWSDLINDQNQLVYGDNWFATGPKAVLESLFAGFSKDGPESRAPVATSYMTTDQSNIALCSSLTYSVVSELVLTPGATDLQQYYDNYPGLETLSTEIAAHATSAGVVDEVNGDSFLLTNFLTRYDNEIKQYCNAVA